MLVLGGTGVHINEERFQITISYLRKKLTERFKMFMHLSCLEPEELPHFSMQPLTTFLL